MIMVSHPGQFPRWPVPRGSLLSETPAKALSTLAPTRPPAFGRAGGSPPFSAEVLMSDSVKLQDELVDAVAAPADPGRRKFLGSAATLAAAAVGAPAFLAACDSNPVSAREDERATTGDARLSLGGGKDPGVTLHLMIANTLGAASDVKIPALEKGYNTTYLQRVIVDSDRTGTGLATVLKKLYTFPDKSTAQVLVQDSRGRAWPGRNIYKRTDLVYAMKDALATNPLTYGVWKKSLNAGSAVVAITR